MKILSYTPTGFDACPDDVFARILQYAPDLIFTVSRGESAVANIEFDTDVDHQSLSYVDSAMMSLGYFRQ